MRLARRYYLKTPGRQPVVVTKLDQKPKQSNVVTSEKPESPWEVPKTAALAFMVSTAVIAVSVLAIIIII